MKGVKGECYKLGGHLYVPAEDISKLNMMWILMEA